MDNLVQQIEARLNELSDDELNKLALHLNFPRAHEGIQAPLGVKISDLQRMNFVKWVKGTGNIQKAGIYLRIIEESALPKEKLSNTKENSQELEHDTIRARKPWYKQAWTIIIVIIIIIGGIWTVIQIYESETFKNLFAHSKIKEKIPQNDINKTTTDTKTDKKDENKFAISPKEICEDIRSRPVFQQEDAAKYYTGLKVRWCLRLKLISKMDEKTVRVLMRTDEWLEEQILFTVEILKYPQLGFAKENTVIWVSGEIKKVDQPLIHLSNVSLEFE